MIDNIFLTQALNFINILSTAVIAGGQFFALLVIVPTKRRFPIPVSVQVHNAMLGHQTDFFMKPAGLISILLAVLLFVTNYERLPIVAVVFLVLELVGVAGVIVTSRYFNVRTNAMMLTWSLDAIPANYPEVRATWDKVHTIRTCFGILCLVGAAGAALSPALVVS
jgi:hypothetical protein